MKKIFLIIIGIMLSVNINNFAATKKRTSGKAQQTPQSVAVNFINGFFKSFSSKSTNIIDQSVYSNTSVTQRYKNEYREKRLIGDRIAATCPGDICSGYPIVGEGGDIYTGKFKVVSYNSVNGYVTVKPISLNTEYDTYQIKVIKTNGKWMVDDVISRYEEGLFD